MMWIGLYAFALMFGWQWTHSIEGAVTPPAPPSIADGRALRLTVDGDSVRYDVMGIFVLPGEALSIEVAPLDSEVAIQSAGGTLEPLEPNQWRWHAPLEVGVYPVRIESPGSDPKTLNVFVMVPYDSMKRGAIGGYHVGAYPKRWVSHGTEYDQPRGFVRVDSAADTMLLTPHFRLNQFLCKSGTGYPQYVVLRPALLIKLERLLESANRHGVEASTFYLMSAYRTPSYNLGIGNTTRFSRHQYGDAADIFVDEHPADGIMDDLNGDGRTSIADAHVLREWADEIDHTEDGLVGGLSAYGPTQAHGPFVHVDARGYPARW